MKTKIIPPGTRVSVPVGQRHANGTIISGPHKPSAKLEKDYRETYGEPHGPYHVVQVGKSKAEIITRYIMVYVS